ncbi:MAG: putative addiction module antidote [Rubritalea sp.]|jgi:putative addiction module antidote
MTRKTKVRKIGNSYGIILPKEALQQLNVSEGSALYITESTDSSVKISAKDPSFAEVGSMIDDIIQRYPNTLSELAK